MTRLGEMHQLAQTETAALTEAKILAIKIVGATNKARTTIQEPSGCAEQGELLLSHLDFYEYVVANAFHLAETGQGPVFFSTASTPLILSFKCPGSSSEICGLVANLSSLVQETRKHILQVTRSVRAKYR